MGDERLPKRFFDGFTPTRRPRPVLQGYSGNLREVSADQPRKLGRPLPGPTYVENSEDWRSNLRSQPHHRRHLKTPTPNRFQRVHVVNGHSGRQLDLLDTSGPSAASGQHQPASLRPPLPRRQPTLTALQNHHYHHSPPPPPPERLPLWRLPCPPTLHTILTHQPYRRQHQ
ncbi:hypothetical protein SprV_0200782900 [Sparganum proliferum]